MFLFMNWSLPTLLECYFIPYLIFTAWLSMVTYLQHTDEKVDFPPLPSAVFIISQDGEPLLIISVNAGEARAWCTPQGRG